MVMDTGLYSTDAKSIGASARTSITMVKGSLSRLVAVNRSSAS